MNQEDLLDIIDYDEAIEAYESLAKALRAVVELHKPVEDNRCEACYREEYFGGKHLEIGKYPCSTIQAIEEALK